MVVQTKITKDKSETYIGNKLYNIGLGHLVMKINNQNTTKFY